jgi:hypothetical protein
MLEVRWGLSSSTWWAARIQRVEEPRFKLTQPPAKQSKTTQQTTGHNPQLELCPKSIKCARILGGWGGFRIFFFFEKIGKRMKWGKKTVRRRLREAGGGGVVVED